MAPSVSCDRQTPSGWGQLSKTGTSCAVSAIAAPRATEAGPGRSEMIKVLFASADCEIRLRNPSARSYVSFISRVLIGLICELSEGCASDWMRVGTKKGCHCALRG